MAGTSFGRYRLVRLLARGGMAEVYLAVLEGQAGFEKRLALKRILPVYVDLDEFTELFIDEARISVSLDHSNIVQTFDFGLHEGEPFIAMEYVDGPDLEKVLTAARKLKRPLGYDAMLYVATRVAAALDYAHSRIDESGRPLSIIHRDVSPPNVLLSVSGDVKITDFGVARYAMRLSRSRPGVVRGKYAYMSPEQLLGNEIDNRSDIFSLGTVLYEMTAGQNPFLGTTDYKTMERVVAAAPGPVQAQRPGMPEDLARVITRCLHPTPDGRYQTAGELRRDLAAVQFRRGVLDDPASLIEELWALFPRQLARRGVPLKSRPKLDISTPSIGAPRMRGPGPKAPPQIHAGDPRDPAQLIQSVDRPDDFDGFDEDDLTIPHIVSAEDSVPTQPLDGDSRTLDAPQQVPASLARMDVAGVSDPFGTLMPRRRSGAPVKVSIADATATEVPQVRSVAREPRRPDALGPGTSYPEPRSDATQSPGRTPTPLAPPTPEPVAPPEPPAPAPTPLDEDVPTDDRPFPTEATAPTPGIARPQLGDVTADPIDGTDRRATTPGDDSPPGFLAALAADRRPISPFRKKKSLRRAPDPPPASVQTPEPPAPPAPTPAKPVAPASWSEGSDGIGVLGWLAILAALALLLFFVSQNFQDGPPVATDRAPSVEPDASHTEPMAAPERAESATPYGIPKSGEDAPERAAPDATPEAEATPEPTPRTEPTPEAAPAPRSTPQVVEGHAPAGTDTAPDSSSGADPEGDTHTHTHTRTDASPDTRTDRLGVPVRSRPRGASSAPNDRERSPRRGSDSQRRLRGQYTSLGARRAGHDV